MTRQTELGEEKISTLLIRFSTPAIIGMVVNTLYNIIDRMYIGNIPGEGDLAITGVGVTLPIMTILLAFGMLVGLGTAARVSLKLGQKDTHAAEKHIGNAFTLIVIISLAITFIGLLFTDQILAIFGASASTEVYAKEYIQIIFIGTIFNMLSFGLNHSIRSDGNPKVAMKSMLIGAITNIILDPIFIFAFGMGVRGAAIATVISQIFSTTWILYYFTKGKSFLKIKKENLKLDKEIVLSIFSIGMSPFSMQIAASVVQVIANNALKNYGGDLAIGAMAIIQSISMIFLMPIFGLNQGAQPIIGYNYGAKHYKRVKEAVKYQITIATAILIVGFLIIQIFPTILIAIFNRQEELVSIATTGLRVYLFMLPVVGFQVVSSNYFQSVGKAKMSMFLSLLRQVILLIPSMLILPKILGINGVWFSGALCDGVASVITAIIFYKEVKNLNRIEHDEEDKEELSNYDYQKQVQ